MKSIVVLACLIIAISATTYNIALSKDGQDTRTWNGATRTSCIGADNNPMGADNYTKCASNCNWLCFLTIKSFGGVGDLSSIPNGLTISSATLKFTRPDSASVDWLAYQMQALDWSESSFCWDDWNVASSSFASGTSSTTALDIDVTSLAQAAYGSSDERIGVVVQYNGYRGCFNSNPTPVIRAYSSEDGTNPPNLQVVAA